MRCTPALQPPARIGLGTVQAVDLNLVLTIHYSAHVQGRGVLEQRDAKLEIECYGHAAVDEYACMNVCQVLGVRFGSDLDSQTNIKLCLPDLHGARRPVRVEIG